MVWINFADVFVPILRFQNCRPCYFPDFFITFTCTVLFDHSLYFQAGIKYCFMIDQELLYLTIHFDSRSCLVISPPQFLVLSAFPYLDVQTCILLQCVFLYFIPPLCAFLYLSVFHATVLCVSIYGPTISPHTSAETAWPHKQEHFLINVVLSYHRNATFLKKLYFQVVF